jgi:hypothetical protein
MDDSHFDALTRSLGGGRSRRAMLGVLAALGLAGLDDATAKKKRKKKRKKKKQPAKPCATSCAGCCDNGNCKPGTATTACGSDGETCAACEAGEGCQDGSCVTLPCGQGGPCLVFITSGKYVGGFGGLTGADYICQQRAANATPAPLPGTYKAWVADPTGAPSTRFMQSTGPYRLVNGTTIAANWNDLTDGTLAAPIDVMENGEAVPFDSTITWTNVTPNGTSAGTNHCNYWNSLQSFDSGGTGNASYIGATWTQNNIEPCLAERRLYCFQQS